MSFHIQRHSSSVLNLVPQKVFNTTGNTHILPVSTSSRQCSINIPHCAKEPDESSHQSSQRGKDDGFKVL